MKLTKVKQPAKPAAAPGITSPVAATLACGVYYNTENGIVPSNRGIVCSEKFAKVILAVIEEWAEHYGFDIAHIGVYNPRQARHPDGSLIQPVRWSNHAYGNAIDFKGAVQGGKLYDTNALKAGAPAKLAALQTALTLACRKANVKLELVVEPAWWHIGIKV